MLSDEDLERYSRQLMLPDFSLDQQERLTQARVLMVGCGGLGSPVAAYLAAAGVGTLVLADGDVVELSNLSRQVLHGEGDIGLRKVESAAAYIRARYPRCKVETIPARLQGALLQETAGSVDLVADGSDNYPTRFALNRACIAQGIPMISAAAVRSEGQLASFYPAEGTGCYRCLYPEVGADTALSCRESGVMGPVVGVVGTLQALEILKVLSGWGEALLGRVLYLDLRTYGQHVLTVPRREGCPDCSSVD